MISVRATFKRKFIAGIIVSIPALVSILAIVWVFKTIDNFLSPVYEGIFHHHIYGAGFLSAVCIIFMLGIISTNVIGKKVIRAIERSLMNIPVLKSVYSPIKSVMDSFSNSASFKKFVIIEYPRKGAFAFGFLTKEHAVKMHGDGSTQELAAVYIPTNNLYLGEVALFRPEDIFYTGIPVEDGVKIVLSGGIATPHIMKEVINDCKPEKSS
ncbi:MAG: DUF502 domain-containing protein [Nitrospiraceae bacterium]|nr:DUF502 domain-containing protein [Nitrospiraceae bacterium]MDA8090817.1 DUF502 domain-containing protein [Nitrospiraceae bacterium]